MLDKKIYQNETKLLKEKKIMKPLSIGNWYKTFMYMNIPFIGWIYLFVLSRSKKQPLKQEFARALLLYKITILISCIVFILIGIKIMLPYIDNLLAYMEML